MKISTNYNRLIASPNFSANQNVSKPSDEKTTNPVKIAIGLGLLALGSYGVYAFTRGRVKPKDTPAPELTNPVSEIKGIGIEAFREAGNKLKEGKAFLANGTGYSGNIISECNDGAKVVMEYVDGVLQKSTKTAKDGTKVFDKEYSYIYQGKIPHLNGVKKNGETILDENKLIETYEKANTKLYEDWYYILVKYPNTIKNLEEINVDIAKIEDTELRKVLADELVGRLEALGYKFSDEGKIVLKTKPDIELKKGLISLKEQNKYLLSRYNAPVEDSKLSMLFPFFQRLDSISLQEHSIENLAKKVTATLEGFGCKFMDVNPKNYHDFYLTERSNRLDKPSYAYRAIANKDDNCIVKGKVFLPKDF